MGQRLTFSKPLKRLTTTLKILTSHMARGADWVPLNQRDHLSFFHILAIAAGTLAATLLWAIIFTLFNPLCETLKLSSVVKTLLLLWGSVAGFIINPVLGAWSDASMCRWGRRRPFMIGGGLMLIVAMLLMMFCEKIGEFMAKDDPLPAQQGVFITSVILAFVAGNIVQSPARTLCSDVVPQKQQVLMANVVLVYGGIGGILTNLCGGLELYKYTALGQEQFILVVCLVISGVAITLTILATPEEPLKEKPPSKNAFKLIWQAMKRMPTTVTRALVCYFLGQVASYEYGIQFSHFMGKEIFGGDNASKDPAVKDKYQKGLSWAMMCNVVYYGSQFLYSFANTKVCEKLTMRWVFVTIMVIFTAISLTFFWVSNKYAFMVLSLPAGICNCVYCSVPYALVSLAIPTEELGGNLGLLVCAGVFGQQVANFAIGAGCGAIWDNSPRILLGVSAIPSIIAGIAGLWILKPRENAYNEYRRMVYESMDERQTTASLDGLK